MVHHQPLRGTWVDEAWLDAQEATE